jgi:hypothetical protein
MTSTSLKNEFAFKQALARKTYKRSPFLLGRNILGYDKFGQTHLKWDEWLLKRICLKGLRPVWLLLLQPRETYKTTYFTISLPMTMLLNNPELSIFLGSDIKENSIGYLTVYGDWVKPHYWDKSRITVNRKTKNLKEPSIWTGGVNGSVLSKHPDVAILDDIAGDDDRESPASRAQTLAFFQRIWDLVKKQTGIVVIPGTRKHINDIYNHILTVVNPQLIKEGLQPFEILIGSAHENAWKTGDISGKVMYPDVLPEKVLRQLRIVKEGEDGTDYATYMSEYEQYPLDPKAQIFKTFHFVEHQDFEYETLVQWTDPAVEDSKGACYSAIVVVAKVKEGNGYQGKWLVLYASIEKRTPTKTIEDHNRIYWMLSEMFPDIPFSVYMESNGFQSLMKDDAIKEALKKKDKDGKDLPPVPTVGKKNMTNKDTRIKWRTTAY